MLMLQRGRHSLLLHRLHNLSSWMLVIPSLSHLELVPLENLLDATLSEAYAVTHSRLSSSTITYLIATILTAPHCRRRHEWSHGLLRRRGVPEPLQPAG